MSAPTSAQRFAAALRAEGLTVIETDGWQTHNRNHVGAWGPLHGVMIHHTVTGPKVNAVPICRDGYDGLPGPLCQGVIRRDGTVHLTGYGRANHAGGGDPNVLAAVKDERYNNRPPVPHQHQGSAGAVDGNAHFIGFECENLGDGQDPWPLVQVEAIIKAAAAVCRLYGWTEKSVIGHSEWSDWKNDPRGAGISMPDLRRRIALRMRSTTPPKTTTPAGGPVSANLSHLLRAEGDNLLPGSSQRIYWTVEHADEPNQHGAGGYSVLSNADWSATLHLHISGLGTGESLQVRHIETDTGGTPEAGPVAHVDGKPGGGSVTRAVALQGSMRNGDVLSFEVTNLGAGNVTLHDARLILLSWPL